MSNRLKTEAGRGSSKAPWLAFLPGLAALAVYAVFGPAPEWLVYSRDGLQSCEIWRLFGAHLVHSDPEHLIVNVVALVVLAWAGSVCGLSVSVQLGALIVGSLVVTAGLWLARPDLAVYCGLSGILNTLFVLVLFAAWARTRSPLILLAAVGYAAKTAIEWGRGTALFTATEWPPVAEAHVFGALAAIGILAWMFLWPIVLAGITPARKRV